VLFMETSPQKRPNWDEYFCEIIKVTASRSPCDRLHVGCLLVSNHRIISQGYNGFLPGCSHISIIRHSHEQATVHAEQNAIADCAKRGVSCDGCIAYITYYPCIICTRIMLASGIKHIKYIHDYKNDELVPYFCKQLGVPIEKLEFPPKSKPEAEAETREHTKESP
jgi:dCMP deaminase